MHFYDLLLDQYLKIVIGLVVHFAATSSQRGSYVTYT